MNKPIETLRLTDRDKAKLLWAIEEANRRDDGENQRRLRVPCKDVKEAILDLKSTGTGSTKLNVLIRNLSRWGAALVHGRYVHPETKCELLMQAENGAWHKQVGVIRHSRHIQGMIHEIGVAFEEPIDLSEFARLTTQEEAQYLQELADDMPEPSEDDEVIVQLSSRVLLTDDYASDRKLFGHWLSQAGFTVSTMVDGRGTRIQIQEQVYDLVIIDYRLDGENGVKLIHELRQGNFTAPIICISSDDSDDVEQAALDAGANRFLQKPFSEQQLLSTAYELTGVDNKAEQTPIYSTFKDKPEMRPLLTEFTRGLSAYVDELRDANAQGDIEALDYISHRLKGAGNGYGYPDITKCAAAVINAMNADAPELESIKNAAGELISTLNRIKLG
ncbi:MAG: response regulator [Phycisphaeraceae bacterium]